MEYTQQYENSLHFSTYFQQYASDLADLLVKRYELQGKTILEIGCGKGDFLRLLCSRGKNRGIGFDPSYVPAIADVDSDVAFVPEFYSDKHVDREADFICCRHVLEHVANPAGFVANVRKGAGQPGRGAATVFFEVPNALYMLRGGGVWDAIYEHCSYFSPSSLACLFERQGLTVRRVEKKFGGQFLTIEASPGAPANTGPRLTSGLMTAAEAFSAAFHDKVESWRQRLAEWHQAGRRVVVWGAGSKAMTFMNALRRTQPISYVIDINARKAGMFAAGVGLPVAPPEVLKSEPADVIIVMNPNYESEIRARVRSLGVSAEIALA
jgi:SAM-dependent methyltransferase